MNPSSAQWQEFQCGTEFCIFRSYNSQVEWLWHQLATYYSEYAQEYQKVAIFYEQAFPAYLRQHSIELLVNYPLLLSDY